MRLLVSLAIVTVAFSAGATVVTGASPEGRISGLAQISFGCPGPVREGAPPCEHWVRFPHARFSLAQIDRDNKPIVGSQQTISSNSRGQFTIALPSGRYLLKPLPQTHTHGGPPLHLEVHAAATRWALVRYWGYPQML